jgi:fumarate hydratase class II
MPHIGYAAAATVARQALAGKGTIRDLVLALGRLASEQLDELLRVDWLPRAPNDV